MLTDSTLRLVVSIFLIVHGLVHVSLTTVPAPVAGALRTPFWPGWWRPNTDPAWFASRLGLPNSTVRTAGWVLWLATAAAFVLAGLGLMGLPGLISIWMLMAVVGAAASLVLHVFYWHPWLVLGVIIDVAVLAALWLRWPAALFPG